MQKWLGVAILFSVSVFSYCSGVAQASQTPAPSPGPMALQVRGEFLYAWNAYKQYAWGHDELRPLSKGYHDWHKETLLMTPVDALDTMILMGLTDEAKETREY